MGARSRLTRRRVTSAAGVVAVATAVSAPVLGAGAGAGVDAVPATVEREVTLVQRVAPQVTIEALVGSGQPTLSRTGGDLVAASALGSFDVPQAALTAYRRAASTLVFTVTTRGHDWMLLSEFLRMNNDYM